MITIECSKLSYPEFYYLVDTCNATIVGVIRHSSWVMIDGVLMYRDKPSDKYEKSGYDLYSLYDDLYHYGGAVELDHGVSVRYI